ncbi:MAG TPA: UDP-2,3-diacylglucosamine diphosphatase [Rhodanobacteraceae bacterium]|nr:UDP-2,3-diacylglucosamine diphosphatase [Rhodanobacteraceae bacterium]
MTTLFISDLHLDPARPHITALFEAFLRGEARAAQALYILGDLFESWIGDDDDSEIAQRVQAALRDLVQAGVGVAFLHGNRDFLVGADFAARTGVRLLPDPAPITLAGEATLLMHGDTLCLGDTVYQQVRRQLRDPAWQAAFLAQPLAARRAFAARARAESQAHTAAAASDIMDVTPDEVQRVMAAHGATRLIHGHTHRPARHALTLPDGRPAERIVLGDWYEQGSVLRVDGARVDLVAFAAA